MKKEEWDQILENNRNCLKSDCDRMRKFSDRYVVIKIPSEFIQHWENDRFEDSLHRLSADAHLLAGNYEQELITMLSEAFRDASDFEVTE